jgi:hypothetical protein
VGPIATIVLATLVAIAGAMVVVALDSTVADIVGLAALAGGLGATVWSAVRLVGT